MAKISKKTVIKIGVSLILLGIILYKVDKRQLIENISRMNPWFIPLIIGLIILNYFVSSIRWKKLLIHTDTSHVSVKYLTSLYFIGSFFNNFMPTSVGGDLYKAVKLGKKLGNATDAFTATFMERFTGVVALVCISSAALVKLLGIWGIVIFLAVLAGIPIGYKTLELVSKKIKKLQKIYDSISAYRKTPKVLVVAFLTSFIVQLCSIFAQYFVFAAVGAHFSPFYAMFVFPVIILAGFFIPSINGIGVQDALYIQLIAQPIPGISADLALSASVLFHLLRLGVSLIGGVLYAVNKD
jgi:hypothetical protein